MHKSWDVYFRNVDAGLPPGAAFTPLPSIQSVFTPVAAGGSVGGVASAADVERGVRERLAITHLIRAFQVRGAASRLPRGDAELWRALRCSPFHCLQVSGHQVAPLDPLNINNRPLSSVPEMSPGACAV